MSRNVDTFHHDKGNIKITAISSVYIGKYFFYNSNFPFPAYQLTITLNCTNYRPHFTSIRNIEGEPFRCHYIRALDYIAQKVILIKYCFFSTPFHAYITYSVNSNIFLIVSS